MTPIHHRAVLRDIHTFGLIVPSICLLHRNEGPRDEKPYAAHISSSCRIDGASHSTALPFRPSFGNIHSAAMDRFIEKHTAQLGSFALANYAFEWFQKGRGSRALLGTTPHRVSLHCAT